MKIFGIGGVPASGKSTIVEEFIRAHMNEVVLFAAMRVKGIADLEREIVVLGRYGMKFGGTDRLAFNVMPDFKRWMATMQNDFPACRILFEGDRLFNGKAIEFLTNLDIETQFCILDVDPFERDKRAKDRDDSHTQKFVKSRRTKYKNLSVKYNIPIVPNNNWKESELFIKSIAKFFNL